jgi:hypothetical protein
MCDKNNNYENFDWKAYRNYYTYLYNIGFVTKDQLWWHYVNIGKKNNYIFFDINNTNLHFQQYVFDDEIYSKYYPCLYNDGFITRDQLWWHYVNIGKKKEYKFFHISERNFNMDKLINAITEKQKEIAMERIKQREEQLEKNIKYNPIEALESEAVEEVVKVKVETEIEIINRKTVYYYIDNTCQHPIRTGIQIVSIYLAKELINNKYIMDLIFVKWHNETNTLMPCSQSEVDFFFNFKENENIVTFHVKNDCEPIHKHNTSFKNCIFFCPELIFSDYYVDLPENLNSYLKNYSIKRIYILHDIIPLILKDYEIVKPQFEKYLYNNLLNSETIITNSDFTKNEFLNYSEENNLFNIHYPNIVSIPLPYQYRNTPHNRLREKDYSKIKILLPGTIEFRKQQLTIIKLFNKFIKENPEVNVELIIFGNVLPFLKNEMDEQIKLSNNKIKYLGIITNEELCNLYKTSSFLCYVSKYEGFGFPISESLWNGLPVLTSNFGSMKEVARIGGCFCIDTTSEVEIYEALSYMIKIPSFVEKLEKEINISKLTTWNDYATKIYKEIIL